MSEFTPTANISLEELDSLRASRSALYKLVVCFDGFGGRSDTYVESWVFQQPGLRELMDAVRSANRTLNRG